MIDRKNQNPRLTTTEAGQNARSRGPARDRKPTGWIGGRARKPATPPTEPSKTQSDTQRDSRAMSGQPCRAQATQTPWSCRRSDTTARVAVRYAQGLQAQLRMGVPKPRGSGSTRLATNRSPDRPAAATTRCGTSFWANPGLMHCPAAVSWLALRVAQPDRACSDRA